MAKREKEKDEETIYDEGGREDLIDSDELNPEEEAFMRGYDEADEESEESSEDSGDANDASNDDGAGDQ